MAPTDELLLGLSGITRRLDRLYSLPPVVAHVTRVLNDPGATAQDVVNALSSDVLMAAKVMRLVNSAYFGFPRRIGNLKTAIVVLGFREVRKLVLALGTLEALGNANASFPYASFWRHSIAVAAFSEALVERSDPKAKDDAFVAGMLHDLGKLVIGDEFSAAVEKVRDIATSGVDWASAERAVLGFDHAELGGALGRRWQFPEGLVEAIRRHHAPGEAEHGRKVAAAVHLADVAVRAALIDLPRNGPLPKVAEEVWGVLGVAPSDLEGYFACLPEALALVKEIISDRGGGEALEG